MAFSSVSNRISATSSTPIPTPNKERLIRLPEVLQRVGICRAAVYRSIKEGVFPAPVAIGVRSVAWSERAIDTWIEARLQSSRTENTIQSGTLA